MATRLISAPAAEPLTLADLKAHLNIDGTLDDTALTTLMVVARATVERLARKLLITQTWRVTLDRVPQTGLVFLPLTPVQTVSSVKVADASGTMQTVPGASYLLDLTSEPARLLFTGAVPQPGVAMGGVQIEVVAGYGAAGANVPAPLVHAVRLLTAHWYQTRGDAPAGASIPDDVVALVADWRTRRLVA